MKNLRSSLKSPYVLLFLATVFFILGSPKWTIAAGPWLGATLLLYFSRSVSNKQLFLLGAPALFISTLVGAYEVVPAPLPIFIMIAFINSFKALVPYLIDRWTKAASRGFIGSLIFPAAYVTIEYLDSFGGGGTWGSVAHTQYAVLPLLQIASVFGIWGISFLVYWFASLFNWALDAQFKWSTLKIGLLTSLGTYSLVLMFGVVRMQVGYGYTDNGVRVATITLDNGNILEACYHDVFDKAISLDPTLSQTSPQLAEASSSLPEFIKDPYQEKFTLTRREMEKNIDELFRRSEVEAKKGAKIIAWSEAVGLILNRNEASVIRRAREFSQHHGIYLLMGLGAINPGPMDGEHLYMVNKTITTSPAGEVINTYLKSNPVTFAEPEYGSDDIIPVLQTPYGKISPVICFDADFNHFMRQTGAKGTDLLLVPSGDWKAIAPYHSHMALMRGVENGCSVIRPTSRGTSLASNPYGIVVGESYFFDQEGETMAIEIPIQGVDTLYNRIGDILAYLSMVLVFIVMLVRVFQFFNATKAKRNYVHVAS